MPTDTSIRFVTGSEFGLSGAEQIRLALETISQNGGIATISQITAAVDNTIAVQDPQCRLSPQGKASLRFFVNKVAVDAGYIYKHDARRRGWTITPKGQDHIASAVTPNLGPKMLSTAGRDFQMSLSDVYALLHAEKTLVPDGLSSAAFIRAGVILTVTAWETFIEDTVKACVAHRLEHASVPDDVMNTFIGVAQAWLQSPTGGQRGLNPQELKKWTGDQWKSRIQEHFDKDISLFNTPKSENIKGIFRTYAGFNICTSWTWDGVTSEERCSCLDELISKRGALVHRGRTAADTEPFPDRDWLIGMITLVEQLAWITDLEVENKIHPSTVS